MSGFGTEERPEGAAASQAVNSVNHSARLLTTKIVLLMAFVVAALTLGANPNNRLGQIPGDRPEAV